MRSADHERRREAGWALLQACEELLGVRGPTALAALTGRSKAWWSKLSCRATCFPTWKELKELLPAETTEPERERLPLCYRRKGDLTMNAHRLTSVALLGAVLCL